MVFTFNSSKVVERTQQVFESVMKQIQTNMSNGIRETEIYIPKEIASEVRDMIDKEIEGQKFEWRTVRRDTNQYTGKPQSFSSMVVGDDRYYKLYYHGN